ncbi:MAG: hypothetical protein IID48_00220 [Proteobacteria bacterium]|nr:hypothetical protein [Pseudomonadota bacterium]
MLSEWPSSRQMILKKGMVADMKIVVFRLAKALGLFALSRRLQGPLHRLLKQNP